MHLPNVHATNLNGNTASFLVLFLCFSKLLIGKANRAVMNASGAKMICDDGEANDSQ